MAIDIERKEQHGLNYARRYANEFYDEKKTQKEMCLDYLQRHGSITPLEALNAFGCFRLSAIIYELRHEDGYVITTRINEGKKMYAIYELITEGEEHE